MISSRGKTVEQRDRLDEASLKLREEKNRTGIVTVEGERSLLLAQIGQVENEAIRARIDLGLFHW